MTLGYYSPLKLTGTAVRKHEVLGTLSHVNKLEVSGAKNIPTMVKKSTTTKQRQKDRHLSTQHGEMEWLLI